MRIQVTYTWAKMLRQNIIWWRKEVIDFANCANYEIKKDNIGAVGKDVDKNHSYSLEGHIFGSGSVAVLTGTWTLISVRGCQLIAMSTGWLIRSLSDKAVMGGGAGSVEEAAWLVCKWISDCVRQRATYRDATHLKTTTKYPFYWSLFEIGWDLAN